MKRKRTKMRVSGVTEAVAERVPEDVGAARVEEIEARSLVVVDAGD